MTKNSGYMLMLWIWFTFFTGKTLASIYLWKLRSKEGKGERKNYATNKGKQKFSNVEGGEEDWRYASNARQKKNILSNQLTSTQRIDLMMPWSLPNIASHCSSMHSKLNASYTGHAVL